MHHFVLMFRADHYFKKQKKKKLEDIGANKKISENPEAIYKLIFKT